MKYGQTQNHLMQGSGEGYTLVHCGIFFHRTRSNNKLFMMKNKNKQTKTNKQKQTNKQKTTTKKPLKTKTK